MSRRHEFLSPEGLRVDGRRAGEARRIRCRLGALPDADGSAYLEQGNTKLLVSVHGPLPALERQLEQRLRDTRTDAARQQINMVTVPRPVQRRRDRGYGYAH